MFSIFDKIGEKAVEKIFLGMLEEFTIKDLDAAVANNVNLLDETAKCRPSALALAERLAKQFQGQEKHLNTENVMKWIREKRFDFYMSIMKDRKRYIWLDRQVKEIRAFLFG